MVRVEALRHLQAFLAKPTDGDAVLHVSSDGRVGTLGFFGKVVRIVAPVVAAARKRVDDENRSSRELVRELLSYKYGALNPKDIEEVLCTFGLHKAETSTRGQVQRAEKFAEALHRHLSTARESGRTDTSRPSLAKQFDNNRNTLQSTAIDVWRRKVDCGRKLLAVLAQPTTTAVELAACLGAFKEAIRAGAANGRVNKDANLNDPEQRELETSLALGIEGVMSELSRKEAKQIYQKIATAITGHGDGHLLTALGKSHADAGRLRKEAWAASGHSEVPVDDDSLSCFNATRALLTALGTRVIRDQTRISDATEIYQLAVANSFTNVVDLSKLTEQHLAELARKPTSFAQLVHDGFDLRDISLAELVNRGVVVKDVKLEELAAKGIIFDDVSAGDLLKNHISLHGSSLRDLQARGINLQKAPLAAMREAGCSIRLEGITLRPHAFTDDALDADLSGLTYDDILSLGADVKGTSSTYLLQRGLIPSDALTARESRPERQA